MKKIFLFIAILACLQAFGQRRYYDLAYRFSGYGGVMLPDGKVDQWIQRPVIGGSFSVEFLPTGRWRCLQEWNNASIGVGVSYLNLGNSKMLGSAFAAYGYMNQPFYNGTHFRIGVRPTVGIAAVTKTYKNTLQDGYRPYSTVKDQDGNLVANWSIGSILNAYLAMNLYMDFPIKKGWEITLHGGWQHISNGSFMHPNAGYNIFGGELGLRYHPTDAEPLRPKSRTYVPRQLYDGVIKKWALELSVTGGAKQNYYRDNIDGHQFYGAATVQLAAYWVPISIFRLGAGIDAFYDGYYAAVNDEYKDDNPEDTPITYFGKTYLRTSEDKNCFRVGISIQPEFVVGKLTAGIHVGFYVYDPVKNLEPYEGVFDKEKQTDPNALHPGDEPFDRGIFYSYDFTKASNYQDGWCYMQFVLKYRVLKNLFAQLGLKTHGVRAEFIDAGVGLAF